MVAPAMLYSNQLTNMASQTQNPFKRMKKALKGRKPSGDEVHKMAMKSVKMTGSFQGKSNKLGQGGRAAQLKAQGVPGGVIGNLARTAHAAPGQKNFHKKKVAMPQKQNLGLMMKKKGSTKYPTTAKGKEGDIEKKQAPFMKQEKKVRKASIGMKGDVEHKSTVSTKGNLECKTCGKKSKHAHAKKKSASK